jgi:tetratricopeptide (TPR) repeat protein
MDRPRVSSPIPSSICARGAAWPSAALVLVLVPGCAWGQRNPSITGTCSLIGQVRTDQGVAVRNAMVRLETPEGEMVDQRPATTAGQFFFSDIPKGDYALIVTADGFETYRESVNMREGPDQLNVSINLSPAGKLDQIKTQAPALSDAQAPREAKSEYERAVKSIGSRKYGDARKHLQAAVDGYPCYARAQTELGLVESQQKDYKSAEAAFRQSISCDAGYMDAYLNLGQLLNAAKRFGEAAQTLKEGLRQSPSSWQFHYQAGVAEYGLKHYDLAQQQFEAARSLGPDASAEIDVKLADVYLKENSFQKAYASMQEYLKIQPDGPFATRIKMIMKQMESSGVLQAQVPALSQQVASTSSQ